MLQLFAAVLFLSATLLFIVQPMFARLILPRLGGAPSVWNTCLVFFQMALLAGYLYADVSVRRLGVRRQAVVHLLVLLVPLAFLPITVSDRWVPPLSSNPVGWLLVLLTVTVGPAFFVVASTAPLLQRWFAATGDPAGRDPYFLYAVSNLGSLGALLAYPLVLEPTMTLSAQTRIWGVGYAVLVVLIAVCAWQVRQRLSSESALPEPSAGLLSSLPLIDKLRWLLLSFVPASLLIGVTTYISAEVASVPLLWILPLALYLLTFVLVFARRHVLPRALVTHLLPLVLAPPLFCIVNGLVRPLAVLIPLHLAGFFVAAMMCHGELARRRPPPAHLTEFYLWMGIGGALGGLFNVLGAPFLFRAGTGEYQLALVLACMLRPSPDSMEAPAEPVAGARWRRSLGSLTRASWLDLAVPILIGVGVGALAFVIRAARLPAGGWLVFGVIFGIPLFASLALWHWPVRSGLSVAAILLVASIYGDRADGLIHSERNFFGALRVLDHGPSHVLMHGTTNHGAQAVAAELRCEPLTYYHQSGPVGDLFRALDARARPLEIGVVGLGTGTTAGYARPGQRWTFYEIDPAILRIAMDQRYFTYLRDCLPDPPRVVLGDARRTLAEAPDGVYDLLVIDAFSSDAMPVHLMTREAFRLYLRKLAPAGLLAINISSRHFNLQPVLANLARELGVVAIGRHDDDVPPDEQRKGRVASSWVVMARQPADLGALVADRQWERLRDHGKRAWTDDFSDIISVLRWDRR